MEEISATRGRHPDSNIERRKSIPVQIVVQSTRASVFGSLQIRDALRFREFNQTIKDLP